MVMPLMGADLNSIIKTQKLSDDHIQVRPGGQVAR